MDYFFEKLNGGIGKRLKENIRLDILEILEQAGIEIEEDEIQDYYDFRSGITKKGVEKMLESMGVIKNDREVIKELFIRVALVGSIAMLIFLKKKYRMVSPIEGMKKIIKMLHKVPS